MKQKKKQTHNTKLWVRRRHRIFRRIVDPFIRLWMKHAGISVEPFPEGRRRQFLILFNHQTPYDQFFPVLSFRVPVYFVATEDIFSMGLLSSLLRFFLAPVPIRKMTMDLTTIRKIMQIAGEGGTIAIAPEGNRTYSGKTEYINPAIAHLAKMLKLPIVLYRIEGGYGFWPRWGEKPRKGTMHAFVSRVIEPEEAAALSREALFEIIRDGLMVNEAAADAAFVSKRKAEYIERAVYVCPFCGLSAFQSSGNEAECRTCHRKIVYGEKKEITGIGFDFPFRFFNEWYEYQNAFVNQLDLSVYKNICMFTDTADVSEVIVYKKKKRLFHHAEVSLFGDRIELKDAGIRRLALPFREISAAAVLGKNKLNVYHGDKIYQFKGEKQFNALKYVNLYYRYVNRMAKDKNGKFLGL